MLTFTNVILYWYMSEENITPPQSEADHFQANLDIQDADANARFQRELRERSARFVELKEGSEAAKATAVEIATGATVLAVAGAIMAPIAVNSIDHHAEQVVKENQQWQQEAEQHENEFYQKNNILPPEMEEAKQDQLNPEPTPSPIEIPSPTQQSIDVQLPTLPSSKQIQKD
jgi:glucan-binding YG repeat protein